MHRLQEQDKTCAFPVWVLFILTLMVNCKGNPPASDTMTPSRPLDAFTVLSTSPKNAENEVPINAHIRVIFSTHLNSATISSNTVIVQANNIPITGNVEAHENALSFRPTDLLAKNTKYVVLLVGGQVGIQDTTGRFLDESFQWTFNTATQLDSTAPTIVKISPAANAVAVALTSSIVIEFSEELDAEKILADPLALSLFSSSQTVIGTTQCNGNTLKFLPTTPLNPTTDYTVWLKGSVVFDLVGNPYLDESYQWNFRTGSTAVLPLLPTIIAKSPAAGSTSSTLLADVNVTFSTDMDVNTINDQTVYVLGAGKLITVQIKYQPSSRQIHITTPTGLYPEIGSYTVRIVSGENGIKDVSGLTLAKNEEWTFTVHGDQRVWGVPLKIDAIPDQFDVGEGAAVAMDSLGNAAVVWKKQRLIDDYKSGAIYLARFDRNANQWREPERIDEQAIDQKDPTAINLDAYAPSVAINDKGNILVVWAAWNRHGVSINKEPLQYQVLSRRFDPITNQWGFVETVGIDPSYRFIDVPRLVMDENGSALVVWRQATELYYDLVMTGDIRLVSAQSTLTSGWNLFTTLSNQEHPPMPVGYPVKLVMDKQTGNGAVFWIQARSIYTRDFVINKGWGEMTTVVLDSGNIGPTYAVSMEGEKNIVATWLNKNVNNVQELYFSKHTIDTMTWSSPIKINGNTVAECPLIALTSTGKGFIFWDSGSTHAENGLLSHMNLMNYSSNSPADATLFSINYNGLSSCPMGGISENQEAMILLGLRVYWYRSDLGWTHPATYSPVLTPFSSDAPIYVRFRMAANGEVIVTWKQQNADKKYEIWVRHFR